MASFTETIHLDGKEISFEMIHVEGGSFTLLNKYKGLLGISRSHQINIPKTGFYIAKFPVTQNLYELLMGENSSHFKRDRNPVEMISWDDAKGFIEKLNQQTGKKYRLPSESEWEYASRGGIHWKDGFEYSGSNNTEEVAWYRNNSHRETKEVGLLKPNQLGIHDMSGNVWEWCEDYWHYEYDKVPKDGSAVDVEGAYRVMRGGGWNYGSRYCRVAFRGGYHPSDGFSDLGFRLVLSQ